MKTENHNVAQFDLNGRFTLSLSDCFTKGLGFEPILIDNDAKSSIFERDEKNVNFIDLDVRNVFDIKDLEMVIKNAKDKANEILKAEALKDVEFIK